MLKRFLVRALLIPLVMLAVLYPNPGLGYRQLRHFLDFETMIEVDMPGMGEINAAIDASLPAGFSREVELAAVEKFVYEQVEYEYDWNNWLNVDYWPTAREVWERKREDCDGRAVLAVSILRARGYADARLTGNFQHIWAEAGGRELMGPLKEKSFVAETDRDGVSVTRVSLPSFAENLEVLALHIRVFPVFRNLLLFILPLLILILPRWDRNHYAGPVILLLLGFAFLQHWSVFRPPSADSNFLVGAACVILAYVTAIAWPWGTGWEDKDEGKERCTTP